MRGSKRTLLSLIAVAAIVLSGAPIVAHAAGTIGGFEIDGNKVDDPGPGVDWNTPNLGAVVFTDPAANSGCPAGQDDNFTGGGSTELSPGTWQFSCGSVPSKDDFTGAGIYTNEVSGSHWLFLYFDRVSGNGEAHLNFEFNRSSATFDNDNNPATPEVPVRTTGDLLITLDATNGGSVTKPGIFRWNGTRTSGTWNSTGGSQVRGTDWDVATDGSGDRFHFAEAAIRLEAFNVTPSCPGLGKAWVKSNSTAYGSDFSGGVLKDHTVRKDVPLNSCAKKNWEFTVAPQGIAGSQVFAVYTAGTDNRTLQLTDPDGDGKYTGSDDQVPPGSVTYHFEVRNGSSLIYSSPPATETLAAGETKTNSGSLTYDISLTPADAENFSDSFAGSPQPHVLTATVTNTADHSGLPNVPVKFANLGSCGTLSTTGPVLTNASGQATTTLTSSGPCSTTIRTWIDGTAPGATAGYDSGEATDTATKRFVSYTLGVSPADVENESGTDHVFTVTLKKDAGSGPAGVSGATVGLVLDPGTTGATITAVSAGTITDGTHASCTTDANGRCTVTIHGTSPGTAKLTASYTATNSSGATVEMNSNGLKRYLAFALTLTPPTAENEVGTDHTFTVTLTRDDGSGPAGFGGQSVSLTLDPGTTGSKIAAVSNGTITDDTHAACTTDSSGQCTVTIHGTSAGTATMTASWSTLLSGGSTATKTTTATKTFGAFHLTVTPASATNEVGQPHTFTMTLTQDTGSSPQPLSGETIELALARPAGSDVHFTAVSGGGVITDDTHATCITGADGKCTATINGTTPGSVTLTATWHNRIAANGVDQVATATKEFRAFALTLTPPSATNEVGHPHTFTAFLTQDTGSGPAPFPGETISFVLTRPAGSDAHFTATSAGDAIADDTHASCVTAADGTCTATITATTPGLVSVTATWSNQTIVSGGVTKTADATKQFVDFTLEVTPPTANNEVGQTHEFTVTLKEDAGSGPAGLAGETVHLVLAGPADGDGHFVTINGAQASGTVADCTTRQDNPQTPADEAGTCSVIINSSTPGTYTLTATWNNGTIVAGGATRTATSTKNYLSISVTKTSCPTDSSPRGGVVDYAVSFTVGGNGLTNATFTDTLPGDVRFVSASQIAGVTATTPAAGAAGGTVTWSFPTVAAGSYSGTIRVTVATDAQLGEKIGNVVTLDADEIGPKSATHEITVTDAGRSATGRAYGVKLDLLGSEVVPATPDSDKTNPGTLVSIPDPLGSSTPLVKLLSVRESDDSSANQAAYSASATAVDVDLNVPGVVHLQASSVVAKSASQASATSASSSRGGSLIQDLRINGHTYGNVSEPTTINVLDPLSGDVLAEIHLLETTRSGAAAGVARPDGSMFGSGIAVNGIHVKVHVLDLLDLIVSRAATAASFPSGLACGASRSSVSGSAYALGVNLHPDSPSGIDLGSVKVAQVNLPSIGGQDDATLADVDVPNVLKATVAEAHTIGEITDLNGNGVPVESHSLARTHGLDLLNGAIKATVIEATSDSTLASSAGTATIAHLEIGGTDVCAALGLDSICKPDPNSVLLIPGGPVIVELNEQIGEPGGLTVNAVHIWVLGKGNPLGLPVGADIVISNAHSDAHAAGVTSRTAFADHVTTINVKALSSPTAERLKKLQAPRRIRIPAVPQVKAPAAPVVAVKDIIRDPAGVVQQLDALQVPSTVLDDAHKLVDALTDPQKLLQALADPQSLLQGLADPTAALDALSTAVTSTSDQSSSGPQTGTDARQQVDAVISALRKVTGL